MTRSILKHLFWWILANALLPLFVPVVVLLIGNELVDVDEGGIKELTEKLMMEGFYIFSSLTLFFSLFEDYDAFVKATHPVLMLILTIPIFIVCVIFYKTDHEGMDYLAKHETMFYWSWGLLIAYAAFLKYKILNYNCKYDYGR